MGVFQTDLIVLNEIIGVMGVDALASSHPLSSKEEDIMTPEDISQLFDSITYSKVQCSVLFSSNLSRQDVDLRSVFQGDLYQGPLVLRNYTN